MELSGLRQARERRLLTQAELAGRASMTAATISRIETGMTKARISTVRRLAEALDVDPAELTGSVRLTDDANKRGDE